jgi:hypothetical protein
MKKRNYGEIRRAIECAFDQIAPGGELTSTEFLRVLGPQFPDCPRLDANVCTWILQAKARRRIEELPPKARVKTYRKATGT